MTSPALLGVLFPSVKDTAMTVRDKKKSVDAVVVVVVLVVESLFYTL